jgi:pimeloyl-ACP methyl ester carboxylesterase
MRRWRAAVCSGSLVGAGRGVLVGFVLVVLVLGRGGSAAAARWQVSCSTLSGIPVALAAGEPESYSVSGELCATPGELTAGGTVQLLIHGATYNHSYWNFGTVGGISYSYAQDAAAAGFPTFAIDEIGAGASSHPPSTDVTIQVAAFVAHQIVQDLRGGAIGGVQFGKVIEVGHSFGSIASWEEAATYHDVNGVIITGRIHDNTVVSSTAAADLYPAVADPLFAGSGLDPGYLTTVPGARASLFYNTADADPGVIARDEATKDVFSATEFVTGLPLVTDATLSQAINVPVLLIVGSNDALNCGPLTGGGDFECSSGTAVADHEVPFYSPQAQLRACVVPGSGHDINLALNHQLEETDAITWSYEYIGQGPAQLSSRRLPPDCSN